MDKLDKPEVAGDVADSAACSPMDQVEIPARVSVIAGAASSAVQANATARLSAPRHQPRKSVEGWIVFATGVPAEAESDDIERVFAEYGNIHSIHLNVDRRTGYLKGYALVEYYDFKSAQNAINNLNDSLILDNKIKVDWCFLDVKSDHRRDT